MSTIQVALGKAGLWSKLPANKKHVGMEKQIVEAEIAAILAAKTDKEAEGMRLFMRDVFQYAVSAFYLMAR